MNGAGRCPVCREVVHGDPDLLKRHPSLCFERSGCPPQTVDVEKRASPGPGPISPPHHAAQNASDAAIALALAEEEFVADADSRAERVNFLARSSAEYPDIARGTVCPVCGAEWEDRSLLLPAVGSPEEASVRNSILTKRRDHMRACATAKSRFEGGFPGHEDVTATTHGLPDFDDVETEQAVRTSLAAQKDGSGKESASRRAEDTDTVRGTAGALNLLRDALDQSNRAPQGRTKEAWLVSPAVEHISTRVKDWGWGCGYKNAQMLFSSLRHLPQYAALFASTTNNDVARPDLAAPIPTIREWQEMIEKAWGAGFDPDGAAHFGGKLVNSRRWIGTTEVHVALTWMGIRAKIVDFPKLSGTQSVHEPLLKWLVDHFRRDQADAESSSRPSGIQNRKDAFAVMQHAARVGRAVRITACEPLYLQHRGHSRTIVGVELGRGKVKQLGAKAKEGGRIEGEKEEDEAWLLVFDPGKAISPAMKAAAAAISKRSNSTQVDAQAAEGIADPPQKKPKFSLGSAGASASTARSGFGTGNTGVRLSRPSGFKYSDLLKISRVNMRELKRKDAYQLLYIDPREPPLTELEKEQRKTVRSIVVTSV